MARRALSPPPVGCRAPGAAPWERPAVDTPIHCPLTEANFDEILLHLPSSASLARAVATNLNLGRIASHSGFLRRFRELHPSSPFIGIFVSDESLARPFFLTAACSDVPGRDIDAHRDIAAVTREGDFALTRLEYGHRWRLRDCRNGVLLLSWDHDNSLWVYNPLSGGQPVPIQPCPDEGEFLAICLVDGTVHQSGQRLAVDCFRVVSVQQHRHSRKIRTVVYDSGTLEWQRHPWASPLPWVNGIKKLPKKGMVPMYAASRIFWKYDHALLLVLDTRTMGFSSCPLPYQTVYQQYSIGEIEDGKCYLVCLQGLLGPAANPRLQVWELDVDNALEVELEFKLKEEVPIGQVLDKPYSTRVCDVCTVTNGLAVLTYRGGPQFVVDLQKMSQLAKFQFRAGSSCPYQMPWPPTTNSVNATKTVEVENSKTHLNSAQHDLSEKAILDLDGDSARIQPVEMYPSHELTQQTAAVIPSLSCNGAIQIDKSETDNLQDNTREGAEMFEPLNCDKAHPEMSCNTYKRQVNFQSEVHNLIDEEPCGQRKKLKTNATSCSNPLVVESEIIPTTAMRHNLRVQCRKSSVGQLATTQPLNKDASNCPRQGDPPKKSRRKEAAHPKGARRTHSSHAVHDISSAEAETTSTPAVRHTNLRATCRNSLMGKPATQEKPLCKDGTGRYKCNFEGCLSTLTTKSSLTRHLKDVHRKGEWFPCRNCDMKFTRKEHLKSHFDRIHEKRKTLLVCGLEGCNDEFPNKHELKIHEKSSVHVELDTLGTRRIKCHIKSCPVTFSKIKYHNRHYKKLHQKTSASRGGSGRPRKEKT